MAPATGNTATSAQVQAIANQITALAAQVTALAAEVQKLGDQGTAAVNNLAAEVDQLTP